MTMFFQSAFLIVNLFLFLFLLTFMFVSFYEKEYKAGKRAIVPVLLFAAICIFGFFADGEWSGFKLGYSALVVIGGSVLVFPFKSLKEQKNDARKPKAFDERDIMFSRMLLQPGTERYQEYYNDKADKEGKDNLFRNKPGLMQPGSTFYKIGMMNAADANFTVVEQLQAMVEGQPARELNEVDPQINTNFIKNWAKNLGAVDVGFTTLEEHHKYTHVGRGENYGHEVDLKHRFAIAFTVEMDQEMVAVAPKAPITMESSFQYLRVGTIAVQLAEWIRKMGFEARAHIDANYRLICPLVAKDAGLGEIGRMGLLMTPMQGPRVRLGVVTTDMPLITCKRKYNDSYEAFCKICKKCAAVCPSQSIPNGDQKEIDGVKRWQIDSESCFTYWCTVGTDCGRCMSVCPYSHPNNWMHNFVRWGIRQNHLFRHFALLMDDYFYGKKPLMKDIPKWMDF